MVDVIAQFRDLISGFSLCDESGRLKFFQPRVQDIGRNRSTG